LLIWQWLTFFDHPVYSTYWRPHSVGLLVQFDYPSMTTAAAHPLPILRPILRNTTRRQSVNV